jgi:hypothetical protein
MEISKAQVHGMINCFRSVHIVQALSVDELFSICAHHTDPLFEWVDFDVVYVQATKVHLWIYASGSIPTGPICRLCLNYKFNFEFVLSAKQIVSLQVVDFVSYN